MAGHAQWIELQRVGAEHLSGVIQKRHPPNDNHCYRLLIIDEERRSNRCLLKPEDLVPLARLLPIMAAELVADGWLSSPLKQALRALAPQRVASDRLERPYFVCGLCNAKWFAPYHSMPCPRCSTIVVASESIIPPWIAR